MQDKLKKLSVNPDTGATAPPTGQTDIASLQPMFLWEFWLNMKHYIVRLKYFRL